MHQPRSRLPAGTTHLAVRGEASLLLQPHFVISGRSPVAPTTAALVIIQVSWSTSRPSRSRSSPNSNSTWSSHQPSVESLSWLPDSMTAISVMSGYSSASCPRMIAATSIPGSASFCGAYSSWVNPRARLHDAGRPWVAEEDFAGGQDPLPYGRLPGGVSSAGRRVELGHPGVDLAYQDRKSVV